MALVGSDTRHLKADDTRGGRHDHEVSEPEPVAPVRGPPPRPRL